MKSTQCAYESDAVLNVVIDWTATWALGHYVIPLDFPLEKTTKIKCPALLNLRAQLLDNNR